MSTITKELAKLFRKITNSEIDAEGNAHVVLSPADSLLINNARIALASLEAEAVACIDQANLDYLESGDATVWPATSADAGDVLLYTAPQPLTTSERAELENYRNAQQVVPEPLAGDIDSDDHPLTWSYHNGWNACRAAMLQGKADGTLTNEGTIPATQFKPAADLYGLTSPTGSETSFTFDAVEARDFIDGGWSCQEYVELERFQEAVIGNSPVIPDGWVMVPVEPTEEMLDEFDSIIDYGAEDSKDAWSRLIAAAPKQEVKP